MPKSGYDPGRHQRRSIRLKGYDYTQAGAYFVTICTWNREALFGDVLGGHMQLNAYGRVAATMWERISRHFPHVQLDAWVVMPNHVHGIIFIVEAPRRSRVYPDWRSSQPGCTSGESSITRKLPDGECSRTALDRLAPTPGSLGAIVGNFKSVTARRVNRMRKTPGAPVWQRNYHERIIRNQRELDAVRQYIQDNPAQWEYDEENPDRARRHAM